MHSLQHVAVACWAINTGCPHIGVCLPSFAIYADAFRYDRLVLAGITYNGDLFPCMRSFIEGLTERNYQNRKVAIIENGTWAPMTGKLILGMFEKSKNLTFTETKVSIKSAMNAQNKEEIGKLAEELS